jgi:DUF438 domain-containing protein
MLQLQHYFQLKYIKLRHIKQDTLKRSELMSELINNQSRERQEALKQLIKKLHEGVDVEIVKAQFQEQFGTVTTKEIVEIESALVEDGLSVKEIERLCDVHASVMGVNVSLIHQGDAKLLSGHPLRVLEEENALIEKLIVEEIEPFTQQFNAHHIMMLRIGFDRLLEIDKHYKRKEHLFFPYLEKKGITTPPQVMWGVDDSIRAHIKETIRRLNEKDINQEALQEQMKVTLSQVREMIFKENQILIPLLKEQLNLLNFIDIAQASDEIGYFHEVPKQHFLVQKQEHHQPEVENNHVKFQTGGLDVHVLEAMLNTLPLDMTFVDASGHVRYFSNGKERVFERPVTILGRHVHHCHPPKSVDIVETIIERFRSGVKDEEAFWIKIKDKFVHIRYFAVRDPQGNYLGTLEMTQDIAPLKALDSEKRLLEDYV